MARTKFLSKSKKIKLCAVVISLTAAIIEEQKKYNKKKLWIKKWTARRQKFGCYHNLMQELALEDMGSYRRFIRMDTASFEYLLEKVTPLIEKSNTRMRDSIPPAERLALTLRFLATGETQSSLNFVFRIPQSTISGILTTVSKAIFHVLKDDYLRCPTTEVQWKKIAEDFHRKWNFPMCIGAMDGKHVKIMPPPCSGSTFYNYKGDFTIVLLAVVDAYLRFVYVDVGTNGRISDGGVWAKTKFKEAMDSNSLNVPHPNILPGTNVEVPYVIVADDAFPLTHYIMKPFPGYRLGKKERIFNYRLSRARRVSENAFGVLAARFRIFQSKICSTMANARHFVLAACALHNFLREKVIGSYLPPGSVDTENLEDCNISQGDWRGTKNNFINLRKIPLNSSRIAKDIQNRFCEYFNSVGAVPWQEKMCRLH